MKKLSDITREVFNKDPISLETNGINSFLSNKNKMKVNIIALGDVGTNVLMGLKLLGGDVIEEIGIFDVNGDQLKRLEMEFNQMYYPPTHANEMPPVKILDEDSLYDCHVLIFCASKGVPAVGAQGDMRMMQLKANLELVSVIGGNLKKYNENADKHFKGLVCVVSDPVDQLCRGMEKAAGLEPGRVRGFGLGVMAARARYYAMRDERFSSYLTEGRAFGPHGQDLVIANSIDNYDDEISKELTKLTVEANMRVRDLGFKPFLAPAISSAALSILLTLRGEWCYGSVFFGTEEDRGAYMGVLSRLTPYGIEYEDPELPDSLYDRILAAYNNLLD